MTSDLSGKIQGDSVGKYLHDVKKIFQVCKWEVKALEHFENFLLKTKCFFMFKMLLDNLFINCYCLKDTEWLAHVGLEVIQAAAELPGVRGEAWQLADI